MEYWHMYEKLQKIFNQALKKITPSFQDKLFRPVHMLWFGLLARVCIKHVQFEALQCKIISINKVQVEANNEQY